MQVMDVRDPLTQDREEVLLLCLDTGAVEGVLEWVVPGLTRAGSSLRQQLCLFLSLYRHLLTYSRHMVNICRENKWFTLCWNLTAPVGTLSVVHL